MRNIIGLVFATVALLAVIVLGGWAAGWWFRTQDAQIGGRVNEGSYGYQEAHKDQLANLITSIRQIDVQIAGVTDPQQKAALAAQKVAEVAEACRTADQITSPPPDQAVWRTQNCGG